MNVQRRKEIDKIIDAFENLRTEIEAVLMDEEQSKDSMPESLEGSERYDDMESAIYNLEEVDTYITEAVDCLNNAKGE